jgi:hypothetical protein
MYEFSSVFIMMRRSSKVIPCVHTIFFVFIYGFSIMPFAESSIFIGNAPLEAKEETIREHFKKYGNIKKVTILHESGLPLNRRPFGRKNKGKLAKNNHNHY